MKYVFVILQFLFIFLLSYFGGILATDVVVILQVLAIALVAWAAKSIGENNWSVYPNPNENSSVSSSGPYKLIRHPMYLALLLFFLPVALRADGVFSWWIYGALAITLFFKIGYEEYVLGKKHPEYLELKKKTKRLIPFIW